MFYLIVSVFLLVFFQMFYCILSVFCIVFFYNYIYILYFLHCSSYLFYSIFNQFIKSIQLKIRINCIFTFTHINLSTFMHKFVHCVLYMAGSLGSVLKK